MCIRDSDHAPVDFGTEVSTGEGDMNIPSDAVDEIKGLLKATRYAAGLEGVPGIKAGDCVYDRSLLIAKILWCVIFVVNIVWVAYKTLIAGEEGDLSLIHILLDLAKEKRKPQKDEEILDFGLFDFRWSG